MDKIELRRVKLRIILCILASDLRLCDQLAVLIK